MLKLSNKGYDDIDKLNKGFHFYKNQLKELQFEMRKGKIFYLNTAI